MLVAGSWLGIQVASRWIGKIPDRLHAKGLIDLRVLPAVGCEATSRIIYDHVSLMVETETKGRVWLESVEVREHSGNSASYEKRPY